MGGHARRPVLVYAFSGCGRVRADRASGADDMGGGLAGDRRPWVAGGESSQAGCGQAVFGGDSAGLGRIQCAAAGVAVAVAGEPAGKLGVSVGGTWGFAVAV